MNEMTTAKAAAAAASSSSTMAIRKETFTNGKTVTVMGRHLAIGNGTIT